MKLLISYTMWACGLHSTECLLQRVQEWLSKILPSEASIAFPLTAVDWDSVHRGWVLERILRKKINISNMFFSYSGT